MCEGLPFWGLYLKVQKNESLGGKKIHIAGDADTYRRFV